MCKGNKQNKSNNSKQIELDGKHLKQWEIDLLIQKLLNNKGDIKL
jgi:hypothetical protein